MSAINMLPMTKVAVQKWYRTTPYLLHWKENGDEIRHFRKSRGQAFALPGEDYYFKSGVTYSYIGTRGFKARMLSPNSIFDIASSAVFSESLDNLYILGFLDSALVCFLLGVLNPTINFQIGDLRRLPFVEPGESVEKSVAQWSGMCIALARLIESLDPSSPEFSKAILRGTDETEWESQYSKYEQIIANVNGQERLFQREIDNAIFTCTALPKRPERSY